MITSIDCIEQIPNQLPLNRGGWTSPRILNIYICAFRKTGDSQWLDVIEKLVDTFCNSTDLKLRVSSVLGKCLNAFSTSAYSNTSDGYFASEPSHGLYSQSLAEAIMILHTNNRPINQDAVDLCITLSNESISLIKEYNGKLYVGWDESLNDFRSASISSRNVPMNMQSVIISGLLVTWKMLEMLGHSHYSFIRDKWYPLAESASKLITRGDRLEWLYVGDHRIDDWGHSGATIQMIGLDRVYGGVFSESDEDKTYKILELTSDGQYLHPYDISGSQFNEESAAKFYDRFFSVYLLWAHFLILTNRDHWSIPVGLSHRTNNIHERLMNQIYKI